MEKQKTSSLNVFPGNDFDSCSNVIILESLEAGLNNFVEIAFC